MSVRHSSRSCSKPASEVPDPDISAQVREALPMTTISYMTDVVFAVGAVRELRPVLERHRIGRPFIVTDRGVVAAGLTEVVTDAIGRASMFDQTPPNPTEEAVLRAVSA